MMAPVTPRWLSLIAATALAMAVGCGGETGVVVNQDDNQNQNQIPDNQYDPPDDLDDTNQLLHVEPCDAGSSTCGRSMSVGDSIALRAQLVDADGDPISNAMISFQAEIVSGAEGASLSSNRAITNSNGIASVDLRTEEDNPAANMGSLNVTAMVEDFDIDPILFNIGISSKEGGSYIIRYHHDGDAQPQEVHTLMMSPDLTCDDLWGHFQDTSSWSSCGAGASPGDGFCPFSSLSPAMVLPNGEIPNVVNPQVSNGESFTVVGRALRVVGNGDVEVAFGCTDDAPAVELGVDVTVDVDLLDQLPTIGSSYSVQHGFDLTDGLPPGVNLVIDLLATLANDPAMFILGCPATNTDCPAGGQTGLVDLVINSGILGSSVTNTLEGLRDQDVWLFAVAMVNDLIEDIMPSWWNAGAVAVGDITDMLTEFTVTGRMFFDTDPTIPTSFPTESLVGVYEDNEQRWDSIVLQWSQGCDANPGPNCNIVPISTDSIGAGDTDVIRGDFNATVLGIANLQIESHTLNLQYGDLIMAVVEQVLLPWLFPGDANTPPVNSLEGAIAQLVTCSDLIGALGISQGTSMYDAMVALCDNLFDNATQSLRDYISSFVASGDDTFRIMTPAAAHCTIHQPDLYPASWTRSPRPIIDRLGLSDDRCEWDTEISVAGTDLSISGVFHGTIRDQALDE